MTSEGTRPPRDEKRLRNPFSNEGDAFRLLVIVLTSGLVVVLLAALVSRVAALVLAGVLLAVAAVRVAIWGWRWFSAPDSDGSGSRDV